MDISHFTAGEHIGQGSYRCFVPGSINTDWSWSDPEIDLALEQANLHLGELSGITKLEPGFASVFVDVNTLQRMHIITEATRSSRIEGIVTSVEEAVSPELAVSTEVRNDWKEVQNYMEALQTAIQQLEQLPLSTRLLRDAHRILMQGVRGQNKSPGEFRRIQNRIGGTSYEDAEYIPPAPQYLPELLSDWEKFVNNDQIAIPHLIRVAIAHYQFEAIHPFLDGNGRIGRLMITLYLLSNNLLTKPTLYLSSYFDKERPDYYRTLSEVSRKGNLVQWILFFLRGVAITAQNSVQSLFAATNLKRTIERNVIPKIGKNPVLSAKLLDYLFIQPVITSEDVMRVLDVAPSTANEYLDRFIKQGILIETTGNRRNRRFAFAEYLQLYS